MPLVPATRSANQIFLYEMVILVFFLVRIFREDPFFTCFWILNVIAQKQLSSFRSRVPILIPVHDCTTIVNQRPCHALKSIGSSERFNDIAEACPSGTPQQALNAQNALAVPARSQRAMASLPDPYSFCICHHWDWAMPGNPASPRMQFRTLPRKWSLRCGYCCSPCMRRLSSPERTFITIFKRPSKKRGIVRTRSFERQEMRQSCIALMNSRARNRLATPKSGRDSRIVVVLPLTTRSLFRAVHPIGRIDPCMVHDVPFDPYSVPSIPSAVDRRKQPRRPRV
jgi:hypothetical protein